MAPFAVIWIYRATGRLCLVAAAAGVFLASWGYVVTNFGAVLECILPGEHTAAGGHSHPFGFLQRSHDLVVGQVFLGIRPASVPGQIGLALIGGGKVLLWLAALLGAGLWAWFVVRLLRWWLFVREGWVAAHSLVAPSSDEELKRANLRALPVVPGYVWLDQDLHPGVVVARPDWERPTEDFSLWLDENVHDTITGVIARYSNADDEAGSSASAGSFLLGRARVITAKESVRNASLLPTRQERTYYALFKRMPFGAMAIGLFAAEAEGEVASLGHFVTATKRQFLAEATYPRKSAGATKEEGATHNVAPAWLLWTVAVIASAIPFLNFLAIGQILRSSVQRPFPPALLPVPWRQLTGTAEELCYLTGNDRFTRFEATCQVQLASYFQSKTHGTR